MKQRPVTSQIVIDEFAKVVDSQDDKGLEKYNQSIDNAKDEDYHWLVMAGEEIIDMFKYFIREIRRLTKENRQLRYSSRRQLLDKLLKENLELSEENKKLKRDKEFYAKLFVNCQLRGGKNS